MNADTMRQERAMQTGLVQNEEDLNRNTAQIGA
jgi:hypothetical protein